MLSYRHGFHAGNPADVFKHAVLLTLIRAMQEKPAGITFVDTHAGPSRYDLGSEWALKTREFEPGIARLWARRSEAGLLRDYLDQVARLNPDGRLRFYPGSPRLIANLLRPVDRLVACELHAAEQERLAGEFAGDRQVRVHHGDGYRALLEVLPPPTGRGLILIDPSYELKDEIETLVGALERALRRFAHGVYVIWYPRIEGRDIAIESLPEPPGSGLQDRWLDLSIDLPPEQRLGSDVGHRHGSDQSTVARPGAIA
jgi:23S rRNA (adenine2030-N6)-methyltransferase